jgi:hypothetical protein
MPIFHAGFRIKPHQWLKKYGQDKVRSQIDEVVIRDN